MPKFLYLECLDHKETSRPVGSVDHPHMSWRTLGINGFQGSLRRMLLLNWGCNSDLVIFTHEILCLEMTKTDSSINTSNAEDMF